jgi:dTDP-4-dehydrorhamnose reductase
MKILLFGGSGTLGTELIKLNAEIIGVPSKYVNITSINDVDHIIQKLKPDMIINCAAIIDNKNVEKYPNPAICLNIIGAANLAMAANIYNCRYVYISTDYIYPGENGNYKETDPIKPFNLYSWTKLGGECSAVAVKNHLIIRTSFGKNEFEYKKAFSDKWTSKDYVDVIAPMILEASLSPLTGVLNLGTDRKTLFDYASKRSEVDPIKITDSNYHTPYDTSLNLQRWINYKSDKSIAKPHTKCRCCGSENMTKYLDLGLMPLANNLEFKAVDAKSKERFPLQVMFCEDCYLSQLSVVIDPEKMFSYYTYRSGINGGYIKHCKEMANEIKLTNESFHIDIAGNDGTLLKQFKDIYHHKVLNVDPASNLVAISESQGIESIADFWSIKLGKSIVEKHGKADLITATNVFAHLDDVKSFLIACRDTLTDNGLLIIENPYLIDFIENMEFDTVYFEHLTYWSVNPMIRITNELRLNLINCSKHNIHGGTMRYAIAKKESDHKIDGSVYKYQGNEARYNYDELETYQNWSSQVKDLTYGFSNELLNLKKQGYKIAGFAASAKGNTLLNFAGINTDIMDFIADETPEKIGKFSPGTGIPIVNKQEIIKQNPDYVVILSWNFKQEIMKKLIYFGFKGKFIIPIPKFEII